MKNKIALCLFSLVITALCHADTLSFDDSTGVLSVTDNGSLVTGNGGRISNFTLTGDSVSFNLTIPSAFESEAGYTNMLVPVTDAVSDRLVIVFTGGALTYLVEFGAAPDLPTIPGGALDLTTVPAQGLPNPLFENGASQLVGTTFVNGGTDTFFATAEVSGVPEPSSVILMSTGLMLVAFAARKRLSRKR